MKKSIISFWKETGWESKGMILALILSTGINIWLTEEAVKHSAARFETEIKLNVTLWHIDSLRQANQTLEKQLVRQDSFIAHLSQFDRSQTLETKNNIRVRFPQLVLSRPLIMQSLLSTPRIKASDE